MKPVYLAVAILTLTSCRKEKPLPPPEAPAVAKTIQFEIFTARDYAEPYYNSLDAEVRLQVRKYNFTTGETVLVWDSVLADRKITAFPQELQKLIVNKNFSVREKDEKLTGSFGVRYLYGGWISQSGGAEDLAKGQQSLKLTVAL